MADYTQMSSYYDIIMTSGYYDYNAIVECLLRYKPAQSLLEIGVGTGLILEKLVQKTTDFKKITGIDFTKAMLDKAEKRLACFNQINLEHQDVVELSLDRKYDIAFSYGGVWYFVLDENNQLFLISHIDSHKNNMKGFEKLAEHVNINGVLLLGIQGPHNDYEKKVSNGMVYQQKIKPTPDGFIKEYYLKDKETIVMFQTINYFVYSFYDALCMIENYEFKYKPTNDIRNCKFLEFEKL